MQNKYKFILIVFILLIFNGCTQTASNKDGEITITNIEDTASTKTELIVEKLIVNNAAEILQKKEVPVLCYHRIEGGRNDVYSVSPEVFASQLQALSDSGYNSILPDQLYNYLVHDASLPAKPFMLTFDDSRKEHITIAAPEMEKRNFKGAFFIMTVTNNKKNYLTKDEISQLSSKGHTVGLHSWDHVMVTKYNDSTLWKQQVIKPQKALENMVDKPIDYWAYPNGVYNHEAAKELDKHFKMSFILLAKKDSIYPLQSVRRMIAPPLAPEKLIRSMNNTFK